MYCIHHLVTSKLGIPAFKVLQKIGDKILFQVSRKQNYGGWLNKNLPWRTINFFLATSLHKHITILTPNRSILNGSRDMLYNLKGGINCVIGSLQLSEHVY